MNDMTKGAVLALALPLALLGGAYASEWLGLTACEMCWWQRWGHMVAIVPALAAVSLLNAPGATRAVHICTISASTAMMVSGLIGLYHAGVEYDWWEGLTACTAKGAGKLTLEDMLRDAGNMTVIRCDEAQWTLLGISLAGYNAIISIGGALTIALLALRSRRT